VWVGAMRWSRPQSVDIERTESTHRSSSIALDHDRTISKGSGQREPTGEQLGPGFDRADHCCLWVCAIGGTRDTVAEMQPRDAAVGETPGQSQVDAVRELGINKHSKNVHRTIGR